MNEKKLKLLLETIPVCTAQKRGPLIYALCKYEFLCAWSPPLLMRDNAPPIQPRPGELMRLYKRWYIPTAQRIPI